NVSVTDTFSLLTPTAIFSTLLTPPGANVTERAGNVSVNFAGVNTLGITTIASIAPTSAGTIPGGFLLTDESSVFEIRTSASVTPPITVCINAPPHIRPETFSNLRILHGEGGVLVDRTILAPDAPAPDFNTKTVCARVNSLSPFVVVQLAPQGGLQSVAGDLTALRRTTTDKQDGKELDDAIRELTEALKPALFADPSHLQAKGGGRVFDETKDAVNELRELLRNKKSAIPDAVLQSFIDRILLADCLLAQIAITDATNAHGKPAEIARANDELSKGDAEAARGKPTDAIEHYGEAWRHALLAVGLNGNNAAR
ncbi:MAG: hypothetical protein LC746_08580, partial [Acidobacteria bacterium]|nr:hypothetical protein [Acidobacteriota bacterium]